ncbi:Hydantoinase/oxoprolinase [Methanosalsum zhilinae DSM 4017]|uniref:Hydantoinase/oxoprolinase n=1 Tax=Methanosalsum zhilinae (strain DSM 4017 / NBRC 107636 / OCM 62 / WeN5) TaxID=679901 RepID=F7XKS1_METZD|nr:hydantoinase/oxoprolinase family protein [Methanosalsum zhilinae]AEH61784.1 Hydantoinase/oxoprolinase [Methanosalsum zhilinae DSM 4017]
MQYSLGIDAGGTYTDAIIVRDSDGSIVEYNKSMTTYPDMLEGIENAIDGLDPSMLSDVHLVSVSTTLATNTVLEGTGDPVALILLGDHPHRQYPAADILHSSGGHDSNGEELESLDPGNIRSFVKKTKSKVSAFAVSSYFSIRNPEHELEAKKIVQEMTDMPVVCGHELSQDIGVYERAVTATLNARLIPITQKFIQATISAVKNRGIDARMLMLKCDGSVIGIKDALEKPIETIFSGPAASLVGASFLTGMDTCAVIDVGGTSTDVSILSKGVPELSETGAVVGGWKTRVRATRMETSAMGGDSHIWVKDRKAFIGPKRVIPLCYAAVKYQGFLEKLKRDQPTPRSTLDENIQPTKFFVRTGRKAGELTTSEKNLLRVIGDDPLSFGDIANLTSKPPASQVMDALIRKRLVQAIGFTPTDVLHVLGEYTQWSRDASLAGADRISKLAHMQKYEFCTYVKKRFTQNMAYHLLTFMLPMIPCEGIEEMLAESEHVRFKLDLPVVLLGGPVKAYDQDLKNIIDADITVPEFAHVGNAAGALFGKGIKRVEIMIKPESMTHPDENFLVFSSAGRYKFDEYIQALDFARSHGRDIISRYMSECGFNDDQIEIKTREKRLSPEGWPHPPMETHVVVVGVGIPDIGKK